MLRLRTALAAAVILLVAPAAAEASGRRRRPPARRRTTRRHATCPSRATRRCARWCGCPRTTARSCTWRSCGRTRAGRFPVILEASPYHGTLADRDGTRILPEPRDADGRSIGLTGYFAPRGYAVVMMDLRGTGRSEGCLDHLGPKDARDLEQVVEWAAVAGLVERPRRHDRPLVRRLDAVGRGGAAARRAQDDRAERRPGVDVRPPVPGGRAVLPPVGGADRGLRADRDRAQAARAATTSATTWRTRAAACRTRRAVAGEDQLSGRYADWHLARDWEKGATEADIPVFLVHGVNDNAARVAAMEWFTRPRRARGRQAVARPVGPRLGLLPERAAGSSGPTRCTRGSTSSSRSARSTPARRWSCSCPTATFAGRSQRATAPRCSRAARWPARSQRVTFHPAADEALGADAPVGRRLGRRSPATAAASSRPRRPTARRSAPPRSTQDLVLAGQPTLELAASVTAPRVHLIANLFDESPDGELAADLAVHDQPRAAQRARPARPRRAGRALRHAAAVLRDGPPPARGPPARAARDDERPRQGAAVRPGRAGDRVHRCRAPRRSTCRWSTSATLYPDTVPLTEQDAVEPGPAQAPIYVVGHDAALRAPASASRASPASSSSSTCRTGVDNAQGGREGDAEPAGRHRPLPPAPHGATGRGAATSPPARRAS